jgi:carbonic anhydrase
MLVLGVLFLFFISLHAQCPAWSYDETAPNGPARWGELCTPYSNCLSSPDQSPIDLVHTVQTIDGTHHLQHKYNVITNFQFGLIDYAYEVKTNFMNYRIIEVSCSKQ